MLHLGALMTGYWDTINQKHLYAYWEGCIPDNFIFCNFGLIGIISVLILIGIVGLVLLKKVNSKIVELS
jgi:hypothetical protein